MTETELAQEMNRRFAAAGLLPEFVADRSQFLETPDGLFAEIVVRDETKLAEFEKVVTDLKEVVGEPLDVIVRALWEIERVGEPQIAYSRETGAPRAAEQFPVDLRSGPARQRVWVDVTYLAGKVFEDNGIDLEGTKGIIGDFVRDQLRKGGMSYWDPVRSSHLEINGDTASFIVSRSLLGMTKRPAV